MKASHKSISVLVFLGCCCASFVGARGRTSSLNRKPEPEPIPVEERDTDPSTGCQYLGKFELLPKSQLHLKGVGRETSEWGKTVYTGGFLDCLYHGEGLKTYGDGRIYEGDWAFGSPHGVGKFKYSNGTVLLFPDFMIDRSVSYIS
jgi:hypothetical protein